MLHRSFVLIAALAAVLMAAPASAATPVFPPGQRVGLAPVPGLAASRRFPGFEDIDRHVEVALIDVPAAAYEKMRATLAKERPGVSGPKSESFAFAGGKGFLVSGATQENGALVHRWFLLAPAADDDKTGPALLVRVEVPDAARAVYTDDAVRAMLASVTFRKVPTEELLGLLPFKLTDIAGFRVVKVVPNIVIVTDGPSDNIAGQPFAIVSVGRGAPDQASERGRFARDILAAAPVGNLTVTSAESMRIKGEPGYEIRAKAESRQGKPIRLVQWTRFGGSGFIGILAVAPDGQWDAFFNRFRALRDGVEVR
jgi:hypothetical protein